MTTAIATEETPAAIPAADPVAAPATPPATPAATPTAPASTPPVAVAPEPAATPAPPEGHEPHAPETYALTLPETTTLTPDMLPFIEAEAKAMGLTNDQAQSLVNARSDAVQVMSAAYLTEAKADPEIGGAKFGATCELALKGLDFLFPKDSDEGQVVRQWFETTGLGNHKAFLRAMARIGKAKTEDAPIQTGTLGAKKTKAAEEVLYGSDAS